MRNNYLRLITSLTAGLVIGSLIIFIQISFAALIFSGALGSFLSIGIGVLLLGALILIIVVTLTSSVEINATLPQDAPAVITAVIASTIAGIMSSSRPESMLATILGTMILSAVLTGLFFWLLGRFNLGQLVRFVPYPVIGGFLAGTGWFLVLGAISVMTDQPLSTDLFIPDTLLRWLPGLLFAAVLYFASRRFKHFLIMPALILAGIGLFYVFLLLSGGTLPAALAGGWLLGPFPEGISTQPAITLVVGEADWPIVFSQALTIATILLVSAISFLMNISGLEISLNRNIDLNYELRTTGIANMLAGIGGTFPGYSSVSLTTFSYRLGASSRVVGLTIALLIALTLFVGANLLNYFPRVIAGGLIFYIGLLFLVEWLYEAFFKVTRLEYLLIWLILIIIATFGFLEGVTVGIIVASIFFVLNYSKVNVTRHALSGANYQSNVMRPPVHRDLLLKNGDHLIILELQGYIFFGTAYRFLEQVQLRIERHDLRALRFLLLDFRLVTGIDSSATLTMRRLIQLLNSQNIILVLTGIDEEIRAHWQKEIFQKEIQSNWQIFDELNQGVAWCEQMAIDDWHQNGLVVHPYNLAKQVEYEMQKSEPDVNLAFEGTGETAGLQITHRLEPYVQRIEAADHQYLLHEGADVEGIFFVEEGQVIAKSHAEDGREVIFRRMEAGSVFGEIGVYASTKATADVVVDQFAILLLLPAEKLHLMEREDPQLAFAIHRIIAQNLAEKLVQSSNTLIALRA